VDQPSRELIPASPSLRSLTPARVSLGRSGVSLSTREGLDFTVCHALARDAVHASLDVGGLLASLDLLGLAPKAVRSAAPDRASYLRRPDLGRRLSEASAQLLAGIETARRVETQGPRLVPILADGLSALAVERHALPLLQALLPLLAAFSVGPAIVAEQARVAIGDQVGALLEADIVVLLIGERPGLSSPDSLGAYITWAPRIGRTDAERNCVSNIRLEGLDYESAARKIAYLCTEAARLGQTGILLKEAAPRGLLP
jgi:ethanolamine ammonia-lyase small subunit